MGEPRIPPRYRVIEEVGQGGMAVVYRAQDEVLKREVAIKLLHEHLAAEPESKARLEREAQAVAKLRHDNILEIFDYSGSDSASSYIVTEFIDGRTMKQFLADGPIAFPEVAAMVSAEVGGALAHAHSFGIIHRDVKPENVMIRKDGMLKLTDFGIAQVVDLQRMTITGQLLGSPAYMAPELIEGKPLDFRTDVFSVGIMLYQLATGALPFSGKNPHEVLRKITDGRFADPRAANKLIGDGLGRIIARALARRPDDRYPDVGHLNDDLREYLAEAGLTDIRAELRAYFADPPGYEKALPPRLAAALCDAGRKQLAAGKTAKAMELWNRVLALDPKHPEVLAGLRRLEGRRAVQTAAALLFGVAGVAALAVGIGRMRGASPDVSPVPPVIAATPVPAAVSKPGHATPPAPVGPAGGRQYEREMRSTKAVATRPKPTLPPPKPAEPPRRFALGPSPSNVDVCLDGKDCFTFGPGKTTIEVPWDGTHVVEFRNPCCEPAIIKVGPDEPLPVDGRILGRLRWKPATLQVTVEPSTDDTKLMVTAEDWPKGRKFKPGEAISIPFRANDEGPHKSVQIDVFVGDDFKRTKTVLVNPGQKHPVKVELDK